MNTISNNSIYTDFNSLSLLRKEAELNPESDATLREVAQQFESLFLHMMLKSMRSAVSESDLMSSKQTGFYQEMLDQQLSTELPKQGGIGLADIIVQQLGGQGQDRYDGGAEPGKTTNKPFDILSLVPSSDAKDVAGVNALPGAASQNDQKDSRAQFIRDLLPSVNNAAASLGVQRDAILAQAILETGWGQSVIHDSEGQSSHNIFGIKADEQWQGERVTAKTYEFIEGSLRPRYEDFRAYGSYEESVEDYVAFINNGERYQEALKHGNNVALYAEKIQQAGYATDPEYANKVKNIIAGETYKSLLESTAPESR
ncbi:MAG: flagellar assembly peptidoglycan hydrolase FlgJ [Thiotrichales bacterium]|nr:flagellar assembly peptidoglycan hydrolase FlgJ [Thiotrichales bacterium]